MGERLNNPEGGLGENTEWNPDQFEEFTVPGEQSHDVEGGEVGPEKEKPVGEMSKDEASREYIDLLDELSEDFTSAEAKTSAAAYYDNNGEITVVHPAGYSGKEERVVGLLEGEDGEHASREWTLSLADDIIHAESDWRAAGEKTTLEEQQSERAELDADAAEKKEDLEKFERSRIKAAVLKARHGRLQAAAHNAEHAKTDAEDETEKANERLKKALEAAYSEDYGYGHHKLSYEHEHEEGYEERTNEEYNERFFGDEERQKKIDRAIAIRRRLVSLGALK